MQIQDVLQDHESCQEAREEEGQVAFLFPAKQ
jgi:hypothetical protein